MMAYMQKCIKLKKIGMQFDSGIRDYTKEREKTQENITVKEIAEEIYRCRNK